MRRKALYSVVLAILALLLALSVFAACNKDKNKSETFTVTFMDGETKLSSVTLNKGDALAESDFPAQPSHDGESFAGWYYGDEQISAGYVPQSSLTVMAKFVPGVTYKLTFKDGDAVLANIYILAGEALKASDIPSAPVHSGQAFVGWYINDDRISAGYIPTASADVVAKYVAAGTAYTLTFKDGDVVVATVSVSAGEMLKAGDIPSAPDHEGKVFVGWYFGDVYVGEGYLPNKSAEAVARYADENKQQVIESLRGNVSFTGVINEYYSDGDNLPSQITTTYDEQQGLVERVEKGVVSGYLLAGEGQDGFAYTPYHDLSGKVQWQLTRDPETQTDKIAFSKIANPFENMDAESLVKTSSNAYTVDLDLAKSIEYALTGYSHKLVSFEIVIAVNGNDLYARAIRYRSQENQDFSQFTFHDEAQLAVRRNVSLSADYTKDYEEQPALQAAFDAAAAAKTYTANMKLSVDDAEYKIYRADNAIWVAPSEGDGYGYVGRPDGNAWLFGYENGKMTLDAEPTAPLDELAATLSPSGVSASMFTLSNGKYVLRQSDLDGQFGSDLLLYCVKAFATGKDYQTRFAVSATQVEITLTEGKLDTVVIYYGAVVDGQATPQNVTFTFSDFGSASLPSGVVLDNDVINGTIETDIVGIWVDDNSGMKVEITPDYVAVDGIRSGSVSKTDGNGYVAKIGNITCTIEVKDDDKLEFSYGAQTLDLRRRTCAWEDLFGTFSGNDGASEISVTISATGVDLAIDGRHFQYAANELSYSETLGAGIVTFIYVDTLEREHIAYLSLLGKGSAVNLRVELSEEEQEVLDDYTYDVNLYVEGYKFNDWSAFIGNYRSEAGDTFVLTADGATLKLKSKEAEIAFAKSEITYEAIERMSPMFTLVKDSVEYTLQQYGSTNRKLALYVIEGSSTAKDPGRFAIFVRDDYQPADRDMFVGAYNGVDNASGDEYQVLVDETSIRLIMGDETIEVTSGVDFDRYLYGDFLSDLGAMWLYRFDFTIDNTKYMLRQYMPTDANILYLYKDLGGSKYPICILSREDKKQLDDWSEFLGAYSWDDYSVTVAEAGLTVTLDGQTVDVSNVIFYSSVDFINGGVNYAFDFNVGYDEYTMQFVNEHAAATLTGAALQLMLVGNEYDPSTAYGNWLGYYATDDLKVKMKVTSSGVTFALDNGNLAFADVVFFEGGNEMVISSDGKQYFLYFEKGESSVDPDEITVTCDNQRLGVAKETNEPEPEGAWAKYAGTYVSTSSDTEYRIVISRDSITLSINGGTAVDATAITLSHDSVWNIDEIRFMVGNTRYKIEMGSDDIMLEVNGVRMKLRKA